MLFTSTIRCYAYEGTYYEENALLSEASSQQVVKLILRIFCLCTPHFNKPENLKRFFTNKLFAAIAAGSK